MYHYGKVNFANMKQELSRLLRGISQLGTTFHHIWRQLYYHMHAATLSVFMKCLKTLSFSPFISFVTRDVKFVFFPNSNFVCKIRILFELRLGLWYLVFSRTFLVVFQYIVYSASQHYKGTTRHFALSDSCQKDRQHYFILKSVLNLSIKTFITF